VDFAGALRALSSAGWRDRLGRAEYFITEGGENVIGDDGKPQYFGIDTAEKGPFWLRLATSGTPGHGSRPLADSALNRLVRALERVRMHKTEMKVLPGVERFFRDQAASVEGPRAEWYRDLRKALLDPEAAQALYEDREASALLRNTISITVVKAGYKTNVIPAPPKQSWTYACCPGRIPRRSSPSCVA
jgi:acetylornithine deacetylase/succinyl-diaminopimelate desuccinylase-like protein